MLRERNGKELTVGISIGIAIFPNHGVDREHLIKLADEAMYTVNNPYPKGIGA